MYSADVVVQRQIRKFMGTVHIFLLHKPFRIYASTSVYKLSKKIRAFCNGSNTSAHRQEEMPHKMHLNA